MKAIYVNSDGIDYAAAIVEAYKAIETRTRDVLKKLVGERVAIVRTHKRKKPEVIGYVTIIKKTFAFKESFDALFDKHCVPAGSKYDCKPDGGKWLYWLADAERCEPFQLPQNIVRHGRSWCEF